MKNKEYKRKKESVKNKEYMEKDIIKYNIFLFE